MRRGWLALSLLLLCCTSFSAEIDTNQRLRFGVFGGGSANFHSASFGALFGFPSCCPQYTSGAGLVPAVSLFMEIPLSNTFSHMIRASLSELSGRMSSVESTPVIVSGQLQTAQIQHTLEADIKGIAVEPLVHFRITKSLGLYAGLRCDFSLKGSVAQQEELVSPDRGTFENGSRIRNVQAGGIYALQPIVVSALGGFRVELPVKADGSMLLIPELSLSLGLNTITGSEEWRVNSLRFGLGLAFQAPRQIMIPTVNTEPDSLQAEISALPLEGTRELVSQPVLIEDFETIEVQPLLPYIFFEVNSDALPVRYKTFTQAESDSFEIQSTVRTTPLGTYHGILNIIGKRLKQMPTEHITLTGINDSAESRSAELARRRVENISMYFQTIWGIDRKRVTILTRAVKPTVSGEEQKMLAAENRRIEITASTAILAPLQRRDTTRIARPRFLRLRPHASGTDVVAHWDVILKQHSSVLKSFGGIGSVPFKLSADLQEPTVALRSDSLEASFIVSGRSGIASSAEIMIPTNILTLSRKRAERIADTVTLSTSLLLMNEHGIDSTHIQQMSILMNFNQNTAVYHLSDFSDPQGKSARLLEERFTLPSANIHVIPPSGYLYSNTYPENRFYNRSVVLLMKSVRE